MGCFVGHMGWFGHGRVVSLMLSMMRCDTRLNVIAGLFHCGHFFGISVGMVSKMSYTQKSGHK